MAMAMQRDLVSPGDDLPDHRRPALHLLADQEERRASPDIAEDLQDRRRPLRMRSVVEGQAHGSGVRHAVADAERAAQERDRALSPGPQ